MDPDRDRLESRVARLEETVARIDQRLRELEPASRIGHGAIEISTAPERSSSAFAPDDISAPQGFSIADLGRGFLIMAGAFMLRALTDLRAFPIEMGVGLGLVYAILWIIMAGRAASHGRAVSAGLFSVTSSLIIFPLIWEVPTRLHALGSTATAVVLAAVVALALFIAIGGKLRILAWLFTLGGLLTSLPLILATKAMTPFLLLILLLGLTTTWIAYRLKWHGLRWGPALAGDLAVLFMVSLAAREGGIPSSYEALGRTTAAFLAIALVLIYLGSFILRTLVRRRDVTQFELLQSAAVLLIGYGGAARIAIAADSGKFLLGSSAILAATISYLVSFFHVRRKMGQGKNFLYFTSLAVALVILGSPLIASGWILVLAWCMLSVASATLGGFYDRITLRSHSAFYISAAFLLAGCPSLCRHAFIGPIGAARWPLDPAPNLVLVSALLSYTILVLTQRKLAWGEVSRLPRFVVLVVSFIGLAGLVTDLSILVFRALNIGEAIRIAVLSVAAVALATGGRHRWTREFAWLVYPVLLIGGLKLVQVIIQAGNASTLFVGFTFYGTALVLVPRILRGIEWRTAVGSGD